MSDTKNITLNLTQQECNIIMALMISGIHEKQLRGYYDTHAGKEDYRLHWDVYRKVDSVLAYKGDN